MFAKRISCLFKLNASRVTAVNALSLHNIAGRRETRPNRTVKKKGAACLSDPREIYDGKLRSKKVAWIKSAKRKTTQIERRVGKFSRWLFGSRFRV